MGDATPSDGYDLAAWERDAVGHSDAERRSLEARRCRRPRCRRGRLPQETSHRRAAGAGSRLAAGRACRTVEGGPVQRRVQEGGRGARQHGDRRRADRDAHQASCHRWQHLDGPGRTGLESARLQVAGLTSEHTPPLPDSSPARRPAPCGTSRRPTGDGSGSDHGLSQVRGADQAAQPGLLRIPAVTAKRRRRSPQFSPHPEPLRQDIAGHPPCT